jgi:hypothetical protein
LISLEEPEDSSVLRVETRDSIEKHKVIGFPREMGLAEPKPHSRDFGDVLVRPVEGPNLVLGGDKVPVPANHVVEKPLLLLDHEQIHRSPVVRDLLELTGLLSDDPIEKGVVHIQVV